MTKSMKYHQKYIAAAVQAAPVFLDRDRTIAKASALVEEAASKGAKLVVFPEVFVPGYPYWVWLDTPLKGGPWFRRMHEQSVELHGPHLTPLCEAAAKHAVNIVIGINERNPRNLGTIFNSNVVISDTGKIVGVHRKLAPTWAEKLIWTPGDGSSIRVFDTTAGPLGTLACGENTNTLARFSLLAMGELIHTSNYPAFPFTKNFDMPRGIQIRAGAHSLEGKVFNVVSCSTLNAEIIDAVADTPEKRSMMGGTPNACSGIFGPDGMPVSDLLVDEEGIVYGEIDFGKCMEAKQLHDIIGHYNRFDVFELTLNRKKLPSIQIVGDVPESATLFRTEQDEPSLRLGLNGES
jgi:predicted amidohydrolase